MAYYKMVLFVLINGNSVKPKPNKTSSSPILLVDNFMNNNRISFIHGICILCIVALKQ